MLEKDYRHTASKGNSFIDSPPYWIINELYQFESKPNARMIMGSAAEEGAMNAIQKEAYDEDKYMSLLKRSSGNLVDQMKMMNQKWQLRLLYDLKIH